MRQSRLRPTQRAWALVLFMLAWSGGCAQGPTGSQDGPDTADTAPLSDDTDSETAMSPFDFSGDPFEPRGPFTEEFAGGLLPPGWYNIDANAPLDENGNHVAGWRLGAGANCENCAPHCIASNSFSDPTGEASKWIISPPIALGEEPRLLWTQYKQVYPETGAMYKYEVRISTDKPTLLDFSNHPPLGVYTMANFGAPPHHRALDLAEYKNETVYIAIVNVSGNANDICINFFRVIDGLEYPGEISGPTGTETLPNPDNTPIELHNFDTQSPWYNCSDSTLPGGVTVVTALNEYQHADHHTAIELVDFPEGDWAQVGLKLELTCPDAGRCDYGDYGTIRYNGPYDGHHVSLILNPTAPDPTNYERQELLRYVPSFANEMCSYVDVTPFANQLTGTRAIESFVNTTSTWLSDDGDGWRVKASFVFYPADGNTPSADLEQDSIVSRLPIYIGSDAPGEDVDSQFDEVSFHVPAGTTKVTAHLVASGHGTAGSENCAFSGNVNETYSHMGCGLQTNLIVNGIEHAVELPRPDCKGSPHAPFFANALSTQNLNGWCYASANMGYLEDITHLVTIGADNTLDLGIHRIGDTSDWIAASLPSVGAPNVLTTLTLIYE